MATKKLTTVVIEALEDIKAHDIKLINVSKLTSVFDYIAIASADSTRQTKALAKNVIDKVKEFGGWIYGMEGEQSGEWVLVDCGDVVVHIMQPVVREHYKLEELWSEGKLEYPKPVAPRRKAVASKAPEKTKAGAKAGSAQPTLTKPKATKPKAVKPKAVKPKTAKPKVMKPKVVKPKVVKPKVVKSKAVKPKSTKTAKSIAITKVATTGKIAAAGKKVAKQPAIKPVTIARKKVATTTIKKAVVKKPVARRRKAAE